MIHYPQAATFATNTIRRDYRNEKHIVLAAMVRYPILFSSNTYPGAAQYNSHMSSGIAAFFQYCKEELFPQALRGAENNDAPPFHVDLTHRVTYNRGCLFSLIADQYQYLGGAHGDTVRLAERWNLYNGERFSLDAFFAPYVDAGARVLAAVKAQISARPSNYYPDAPALAESLFQPDQFWIEGEDLSVFYQPAQLAPYAFGIPVFRLPFGDVGAILPRCQSAPPALEGM